MKMEKANKSSSAGTIVDGSTREKVRLQLEKKLKRIEKELDGCRTSVMQDGWQTQRYAKKARKWDILAQEKFKIQSQLEEL